MSFARKGLPTKIFFDFDTDILYFGYLFENIDDFITGCNKFDQSSLGKIAFHLLKLYDIEYYHTSGGLASKLHRHFPKLDEVIFVEKDVKYDWDRHERGRGQRKPNPRRTVFTFSPPKREIDESVRREVQVRCRRKEWDCLEVKYVDYERLYPQPLGFDPWGEEPEDKDDETSFLRLCEQDAQWSEVDSSDDNRSEIGG